VGGAYAKSDVAYYSVMIPAQTLEDGAVTIRATEGKVKQYTLAGATASTPTRLIEAHIARIMRATPLSKSVLERSLSLMRDIPGQTVEARIRQLDTSGALALDLTLSRKQVEISIRFDNDGVSNVVSAFQAQASVRVNGLLRDGDSSRFTGYLPLYPDRYQYYSLSHTTPIGGNGMTLTLNGSTVSTRSIDGNLEGRASLAGISINYPLIRSYKKNLSLTASMDGVNSDNYFLDIRFGDYRARAVRAGLSWSEADDKKGFGLSLVASQGLDALGARPFPGFSENGFAKINLQAVGVKPLSKTIYVKSTFYAQYSRDKLPVTERMAIGGRGAGRAFRAGTVTGESAIAGQLEVGWTLPTVPPRFKGSTLFAYVDGGTARTVARPFYNLPADTFSLASVGGGARIAFAGKWSVSIEAAMPVKRPAPGYGRSPRLFAGLGRSF
jgi:hemolysin activation/secretion protein